MIRFPSGLYCDVRIEDQFQTSASMIMGRLSDAKEKKYRAALIRLFDGRRWFYSSTTDIDNLQGEIDSMAKLATKNEAIADNPIVAAFEINTGYERLFGTPEKPSVRDIPLSEKLKLFDAYVPLVSNEPLVAMHRANYLDTHTIKQFLSSKGADITWDFQTAGIQISFELADGDKRFRDAWQEAGILFSTLPGHEEAVKKQLEKGIMFLKTAVPVKEGVYPVILSPEAAGVFAHESFGHKSEADFMLGDEGIKGEWVIGKKVGADLLSIIDDGRITGSGYTPLDDEGTRAKETWLIRNGVLTGRLHNAATAVDLGEVLTGNARAINFEFQPIVRMTTTYIGAGKKSLEQIMEGIGEGVFVESINHGSGMSTFTIAPRIAWMIRDGKKAEPVLVSVVSGSVFETLNDIEDLSDTVTMKSFVMGGCGKNEQFPLPVGFGGPYVRVAKMNVQ